MAALCWLPIGLQRSSAGIPYANITLLPGSVILLSSIHKRNEPLGLQHQHARTSASSLPSPFPPSIKSESTKSIKSNAEEKKRTKDGKYILEPQPDDSMNDPLNWSAIRRDAALLSLGFYCMMGGGMTPILAAGFNNVAATYHVTVPQVALTTGLYMMGLGLGSVVASPTAILYGKRPVYLVSIITFLLTSVWCALSPRYTSLVIGRIVQGMAVSPVECLPSATVAEIFFLHERAYRLGIYTLLLLGGKNLIPLVSAAIIEALGWRWVFWVVAIVVGFCFFLLFFFVPETFWDRTPRPHKLHRTRSPSSASHHHFNFASLTHFHHNHAPTTLGTGDGAIDTQDPTISIPSPISSIAQRRAHKNAHVGFTANSEETAAPDASASYGSLSRSKGHDNPSLNAILAGATPASLHSDAWKVKPQEKARNQDYVTTNPAVVPGNVEAAQPVDETDLHLKSAVKTHKDSHLASTGQKHFALSPDTPHPDPVLQIVDSADHLSDHHSDHQSFVYTDYYRSQPPKSYIGSLKPWNGRLTKDKWLRVAIRPFILFAYPSVLWSTLVYSLSVGWLIVLSESVAVVYRSRSTYNFTALQTGLVYLSPFIGGVLGTAVAGKVSDLIVRFMARRNDGVYEPEFRLVMAIPVALCTTVGLMGFGWSAQERDRWIVPTVFFGAISFGCSLGSTTAITFCVDSYRQYAGEALVTLNFSKNIFHGLVFSLFFTKWLESDGSKKVFLAVGGIQMACLLLTIPMYIYGKRARMWTVRKNLMERF
ncbi:MFS general substrate transporter [Lepidopterella palustris CBS 459.81]|uniref:MFS general substrate transporter n=1 Tax=Lepidopterella palustris CBS 459.81 TaxID=1314670 RepID=A0A8E2E1Y2_9PEZI|nr:MFS general substrate transporter [Lepidopterella palustris CBS 459.81]